MNASKSLTAAVAAAALVGSIGFAYAQTADSTTGGQGPAVDTPAQSTTSPSTDMSATPSSSGSDMSNSDTTTTLDERADRN
jgi:hypothetical protein